MNRTIRLFALRILPNYAVAAICSAYVFTIGWLTIRGRGVLYQINAAFGRYIEYPPRLLPVCALKDLPWPPSPATILEPAAENGNITLLELLILVNAVRATAPEQVFEIGTFDGRTTLNLAANAPAACTVHTLDLPQERLGDTALTVLGGDKTFIRKSHSGTRFSGTTFAANIRQLYGDSAAFDFSPFHGTIDFLFVDGAHAYDYVISDSQHALLLCTMPGSVIFWHDYGTWPDVTEALNDLQRTDPAFANLQHIQGTSLVYLIRRA